MSAQEVPNPGLDQAEATSTHDTPIPSPSPTPATVKAEPGTPPSVTAISTAATATTTNATSVATVPASNGKASEGSTPAEIYVILGGSRNSQAQAGSYVCRICGKKYKYYNCFQTHVRAHSETDVAGEAVTPPANNSFRYTCDVCGKKYKYYSCFQEHRDLHAVDDPYNHVMPVEDTKEDIETFQKMGPKTGSYTCEYCGKQYKYFNPYQEHVALHTPFGHSYDLSSRSQQNKTVNKFTSIKPDQGSTESSFGLKMEGKIHPSPVDGNNSQSSSGAGSPMMAGSFTTSHKPYTCGACGIQFQFYNNLMEHMQSHAADNENHTKNDAPKSSVAPVPQDQLWSPPLSQQQPQPQSQPTPQPSQRNHTGFPENRLLPEKERQQVSERLLRLTCADLGLLSALSSKDFLKMAQTLVDTGARHGAYSLRAALGGSDMGLLALRQLPRMYNQLKVKVTCALGCSAAQGIAITCHTQAAGPDACYVLTAYQVEVGGRPRRYILGVREAGGLREGPEQVHHWVQNVLSEFVMSEMRTVYVTEGRLWASAQALGGRAGVAGGASGGPGGVSVSLRCAGCSLGAVVQAVLGRHSLQARGLHELGDLLATCRDIASTTNFLASPGGVASTPAGTGTGDSKASEEPQPSPPCWDTTAEALLKVHENFEAICEAYGRSKSTAPLLQGLNKHLLGTLACLLSPLRQAALELGIERRPTLQHVLPVYLRLEKLFTAKAGEAGSGGSKLCHYFLEALKEHFRVEPAHQVAMVLDPQLKLRPALAYQHDDIMSRVCEMAAGSGSGGTAGGGVGSSGEDRDSDGSPMAKRRRPGVDGSGPGPADAAEEALIRKELFQYLAEPLYHVKPDPFQYWSDAMDKSPRLARLALWLLAVPAVGGRNECVTMCQQSLALKRKKQVTAEEMNKLVFLKANTT